ncbi:hypothetical protein [Streptomyces sp. cg36]|uniref:InlB B-repeat-containing protein n=1 Tax=Streptomyces sp. cg36 TaxID=3238798 RepID=UPI0034E2EBAE
MSPVSAVPADGRPFGGSAAAAQRDGADTAAVDPAAPWVVREGTMAVGRADFSALCAGEQGKVDERVLQPFPGTRVAVEAETVERRPDGMLVWSGHVAGSAGHHATLALTGVCGSGPLGLTGHVDLGLSRYEFTPSEPGVSKVVELDPRAVPDFGKDAHRVRHASSREGRRAGESARRAPSAPHPVVDVAMGYTPAAERVAGGRAAMLARIASAEADMNQALADSGVRTFKVRFGNTFRLDDYDGTEDADDVWAEMSGKPDSYVGRTVRRVREKSGADLVAVLTDVPKPARGTFTAGAGSYVDEPRPGDTDDEVWSASDIASTSPGVTLSHELGHNMALTHDDVTEAEQGNPPNPRYPYNRGFVPRSGDVHTVMAYESACEYRCVPINLYSTPRVRYGDDPVGDAMHDAARVLRQTGPIVARYRTPQEAEEEATHELTLRVSPAGGGAVKAARPGPYTPGTQVTVTAQPRAGYSFDRWLLDGRPAGSAASYAVRMDGDHTVTATFRRAPQTRYRVTAAVSPTGAGAVSLVPRATDYPRGAQVRATARPAEGHEFQEWELDGELVSTSPEFDLEVEQAHRLVAVFARARHTLTTEVRSGARSGAVVVSQPGPYAEGSHVVVGAEPAPGYKLVRWSLDDQVQVSGWNPLTVRMHGSYTVSATFGCAFPSRGYIAAKWQEQGGEGGRLGCPVAEEHMVAGGRGYFQDFQDGRSIYWSQQTGAHVLGGPIRDAWLKRGGAGSPLGFPVGDEFSPAANVRQVDFQGGRITRTEDGDTVTTRVTYYAG